MVPVSFEVIGYETKIGKKRWAGTVVATPEALYCVLAQANSTGDLVAVGVGGGLMGAIGGAVAGAVVGLKNKGNGSQASTVGEAPEILRVKGTGPLRRFKTTIPMLIVPRENVSQIIKSSWINNTLQFALGSEQVVISHSLFAQKKVREYLASNGWPLLWRGQAFNVS